ncbi:right-handed parallel beta-helix repeat-containing protein [Methanobrevibacter arboriphilus]|uniref:NosD domain-containing protein n=1 Tax=Methanobrevibacter arboriphilus TaxID=39441 RepID=UPI000A7C69DD|nr:NosD domain-containing protein [Methanobrevibacter arboriphilus]
MDNSYYNNIFNNKMKNIKLNNSSNIIISHNNFSNNLDGAGISINAGNNNSIICNFIVNCIHGIEAFDSEYLFFSENTIKKYFFLWNIKL